MYHAHDIPQKLCNIRGDYNIQQPRLPPNNASRPVRQFKCPLSWYNGGGGGGGGGGAPVHEGNTGPDAGIW